VKAQRELTIGVAKHARSINHNAVNCAVDGWPKEGDLPIII
jgi:hypothetical protein